MTGAAIGFALLLLTPAAEPDSTPEFEWKPLTWEPGLYWVVRCPRYVDQPTLTGRFTSKRDGHWLVRFEVQSVDMPPLDPDIPRVMGGPLVAIRIGATVEGEPGRQFGRGSWCRIVLDPSSGAVAETQVWERGAVSERRTYQRPATRPLSPLLFPHDIPPQLFVDWPLFASDAAGRFVLRSWEEPGRQFGEYRVPGERQLLLDWTDRGATLVYLTTDERHADLVAELPHFSFRNGQPWYEVRAFNEDGSWELINEIVEVGRVPGVEPPQQSPPVGGRPVRETPAGR